MDNQEAFNPSVTAIINARRELSVNQARWVLLPMFGLWILFFVAGVIFR